MEEDDLWGLGYEAVLARQAELQREADEKRKQKRQEFSKEIGRWLKKHRVQKRLSQDRLSAKLGYSGNKLFDIERGKRMCDLLTFMEICEGIGVHFDVNGRFRLEADEIAWVEMYRRKDWRQILLLLADEM